MTQPVPYGGSYRTLRPLVGVALATATTSYLLDPNGILLSPGICLYIFLSAWVSVLYVCCREWQTLRRWPSPLLIGAFLGELILVCGVRNAFFACPLRPADKQYADLQVAIKANDLPRVQSLLLVDKDPDHLPPPVECDPDHDCPHLQTPLALAVQEGHLLIAAALIARGASATQEDSRLLSTAAENGDIPMLQLLMRHGAAVNDAAGNSQALERAVDNNKREAVVYLIRHGANPNSAGSDVSDDGKLSLIRLALSMNNAPMARLLQREGAK